MNLNQYLKTLNKTSCPDNCELKSKSKITPLTVPPPEEIVGIIVSRDPTVDWLYGHFRREEDENILHDVLFASAIPLSVITKILIFMRGRIDESTEKELFEILFHKTYWTHLHKCQTDVTNNISTEFKAKNANTCADKWLTEELQFAITGDTRFIISLGADVRKWVQKWEKDNGKGIALINLPHPSGQNNAIWHRSEKISIDVINRTEADIQRLIDICTGFVR
ncbi:MAG: hypothetical protein JXA98_02885 [Methanosarcinaceae archaeon]|nr:hypothetical protein [Methanosarcinaceae archaeon]